MAKRNNPKKIIIHCSLSNYGNTDIIRKWHMNERKWSSIGYHYIIKNGYETSSDLRNERYDEDMNGVIENSLSPNIRGIHCKGQNTNSIGICLIGGTLKETRTYFTGEQLDTLILKVIELMTEYNIDIEKVYPHTKFSSYKTCPNFDVELFKSYIKGVLDYSVLFEHFTGETFEPDEDTKYFMDELNIN